MPSIHCARPFVILLAAAVLGAAPEGDASWVAPMKEVHAKFSGQKGTFATFGDSITVTMAYWAPLKYARKNLDAPGQAAYEAVSGYMRPECWNKWKGPQYGNNGRMTIRWAHQNVDAWLEKLNPEVALMMFGTNDLNGVPLEEYERKTREVVQRCLDNGTIVILSTIPPRSRMLEKSGKFAEAVRRVAKDLKVPVCDFHVEVLKRRPDDWDGRAEKFSEYKGYDVPTLLSRDGVHPSAPKKYRGNYSEEGLRCSGYGLRNYVSLLSYADVISRVLRPGK